LFRESALSGAFANPGPLNQPPGTAAPAQSPPTPAVKPVISAPIKADLIGKPDDAQLKAALDHLVQSADKQTGSQN
jgi:carboxyl-terminal processing protease